jgi:hypothetical protein
MGKKVWMVDWIDVLLACVFRCVRGGYWRHLYIIWYRGRESIEGIFWKLGVVLCFADYKTTRLQAGFRHARCLVVLAKQSEASMIPLIRNSGKATASEIS